MPPRISRSIVLLTCLGLVNVAGAELPADASVDQILHALHERGRDLKTLAADVKLVDQDLDLGDDPNTQSGRLVIERKPDGDTRIRINFNKRTIGKREVPDYRRDFLLTGATLIERDWTANPKKETIRTIGQPGQKLDLFKLGQGPFPLPIGQPPENVLKEFDVKKVEIPGTSPERISIELTPKPTTALADKFKRIIVTVRRSDGWPVEIETSDPNETRISRAVLENIRTNDAVKPEEFDLGKIDATWTKVDEAYRG